MNRVERHKQYAKDLSKIVKDSKMEARAAILNRLSFLAKKAGGNPLALQKLVAADRKNMMRLLIPIILKRRLEAGKLGCDFGKDRANGTAQV